MAIGSFCCFLFVLFLSAYEVTAFVVFLAKMRLEAQNYQCGCEASWLEVKSIRPQHKHASSDGPLQWGAAFMIETKLPAKEDCPETSASVPWAKVSPWGHLSICKMGWDGAGEHRLLPAGLWPHVFSNNRNTSLKCCH